MLVRVQDLATEWHAVTGHVAKYAWLGAAELELLKSAPRHTSREELGFVVGKDVRRLWIELHAPHIDHAVWFSTDGATVSPTYHLWGDAYEDETPEVEPVVRSGPIYSDYDSEAGF